MPYLGTKPQPRTGVTFLPLPGLPCGAASFKGLREPLPRTELLSVPRPSGRDSVVVRVRSGQNPVEIPGPGDFTPRHRGGSAEHFLIDSDFVSCQGWFWDHSTQ